MSIRVIFIHGINNEKWTKQEIEDTWSDALQSSLTPEARALWPQVEIKTAYYAQELRRHQDEWHIINIGPIRMSAGAPDEDLADEKVSALYLAFQDHYRLTDEEVAAELDPDDEVEARRQAAGLHKKWLKAIARALERKFPSGGGLLARLFLEQAAAYLHKPGVYDEINKLVRDQVFADHDDDARTLVITHSLGTIVGYVNLRAMRLGAPLPLFMTLGSPLGIEIVRHRVGKPRINPPLAPNWVNGADQEDFVALDPTLDRDTFGPADIKNIVDIDNGEEDAHSIARYLADPRIGNEVSRALVAAGS